MPNPVTGGRFWLSVIGVGVGQFIVAAHADYVPEMTCEEVAGFAKTVAELKISGETLKDQIASNRQALGSEYGETTHALEQIIRAIYRIKNLSDAQPEAVYAAYKKACTLFTDPGRDKQLRVLHNPFPSPADR